MARRPRQTEIPGTEQERIPAIERFADKVDENQRIIAGAKEAMTNAEFKLQEACEEHKAVLSKQKGKFVYKRNGYLVTLKTGKTKVSVKILGNTPEEK